MKKPPLAPCDSAAAPARVSTPLTSDGTAPKPRKARNAPLLDPDKPILTRNTPPATIDPEERRQPQSNGRGTRALSVAPESYDSAARTVEAVLSAGSPVQRYYFTEELEISAEAIDLTRVQSGICPLLDTHNQYEVDAVLGRILSVRIDNAQLIGVIQFADSDRGREIEARVLAGDLRAISIGYHVTRWQMVEVNDTDNETWRAVAWELLEASLVPVPADPNAVVRSAPGITHGNQEEEEMRRNLPGGAAASATVIVPAAAAARTEPAAVVVVDPVAPATAPAARAIAASRILTLCDRDDSLGGDFARGLIARNETTPLTEADLYEAVNTRLFESRQRGSVSARAGASGTESEGYRQAVEDAVTLRVNPSIQLTDVAGVSHDQRMTAAREFRGMTLMELARDNLSRTGISATGMGRLEVAGAALGMRYGALTTSDFAFALAAASNKRVRAAFTAAPQTFRPLVSVGTLPDFKPTNIVGLGDAPSLLLVPENGEFKRGALTDSGLFYQLQTYGRIIPITRQAIVNDDQNLFGRIPVMFGRKAADLESDLVWGLVLSNPIMGDGYALFSTQHGNLAPAGGAINVANVGAGRQAMAQQKSIDGNFISILPEYLIVGPAKQTEAEQFLATVLANQQSNVNPFAGKLQLIVEPRITDNSWMLSADPSAFDTIELAHLLGQEELFTDTRVGFDVDGVENKARLDVGAALIDWRGFYKSPAY